MATALHPPTRQAPRLPAARGVDPAARTTPDTITPDIPRPDLLARTRHLAARTARGIGIFTATTAKVVFLGKHGID